MAVTVNATGTKLYTGSSVSTFDYTGLTVAGGTNTAIVALWIIDSNTIPSAISMVWDQGGTGQALSQIIEHDVGGDACLIWALSGEHGALTTGNKTLRVSYTGATKSFFVVMAFDGVDQTGGATSFPHANFAVGGVSTVTITSATGNKVIACESSGAAQGTSTGTQIFNDNTSGSLVNAMCQYAAGAATVAIGNSGTNANMVGCDILAAAGGGGGGGFFSRYYYDMIGIR